MNGGHMAFQALFAHELITPDVAVKLWLLRLSSFMKFLYVALEHGYKGFASM